MATQAEIEAAARAGYEEVRKDNPAWMPWENLSIDSPNSVRHAWIRFAKAALEAAERASWQPIETAPEDERYMWLSDGFMMRIGFWRASESRWIDLAKAEARGPCDLPFKPTLCQLLPSPPVSK